MYRRSLFGLISLFLTITTYAGEGTFARYGVGLSAPDQKSIAENKFLSFGYQSPFKAPIADLFDWKLEAGGWSDSSHRAGRKSNGFVSGSVGLETEPGYFYLHSFFGIATVLQTDSTLGSIPQFVEDVGVGVQDKRKRRMGVGYKHFSNAGLWQPNKGRDFITVIIQFPL